MIIYPAIDLIGGKAVRLERGDYDKKTEYSKSPAGVARQFEAAGARYIHIVDLDGAKAKKPVNTPVIGEIARNVDTPLQVGGGIRSVESAEKLLKYARRVIIGTVSITEPDILKQLIDRFGADKIIVSVDYKANVPAINGWLEKSELTTETLIARLNGLGVKTVIVTDTDKDGILGGPNVELMKIWKNAKFEVICAGGVTTTRDIRKLADARIDGAIIGKALYENKISLKEAINAGK